MGDLRPTTAPRTEAEPAKRPRDFGSLSRRIIGWTSNGLATALILVAGLTFGRQVLLWWGEESIATSPRKADLTSLEDGIKHLEFGAVSGAVQTRTVRGSRDDVLSALRDMCRPSKRPGAAAGAPPNEAEHRLLSELVDKEPAEAGDGWRIDQLAQGLPMVICSTTVERDSSRSRSTKERPGNGMNSVPRLPLDLRIVAIGLAVPAADDAWSAFAFVLGAERGSAAGAVPIPLPAASSLGITLTQPDGMVLTTFRGQGPPAAWETHFQELPPSSGWQLRAKSVASRRWLLEFDRRSANSFRAQVHFEYDGHGGLCGLALVTPADKP